ncbi:MmpS family transport accessory protein [Mycobacterium sp. 012931]|uniref:MmpS family transport accessory protein n=1 Tax=Mycobacterium sp. 012931 TaxID=1187065 RepID=UPI003510909E
MRMIPVTSVVRRMWLLLAVMGVALVAGLGIYRLHRVFGVHEQPRERRSPGQPPRRQHRKRRRFRAGAAESRDRHRGAETLPGARSAPIGDINRGVRAAGREVVRSPL